MENKQPLIKNYQSLVGGLLWLQCQTRPDIPLSCHFYHHTRTSPRNPIMSPESMSLRICSL
jgi:hypothetical protein